jgi:hypothetical protein
VKRPIVVLLLTPAEAELVASALERFRATNGGGYSQLKRNVLQMLETARFTGLELRAFGELDKDR